MQIVIKISEEDYINLKNAINSLIENGVERASMSKVCLAILDGTPLPKGHGDLKDIDNLQYMVDLTREDYIYSGKDIEQAVKSMKSIIEADRSKGEE